MLYIYIYCLFVCPQEPFTVSDLARNQRTKSLLICVTKPSLKTHGPLMEIVMLYPLIINMHFFKVLFMVKRC